MELADRLRIRLPRKFLELFGKPEDRPSAWKFLTVAEAVSFKAELDVRFDYPGREWRGIPFARSIVSEDVACFDLAGSMETEALVIPIRDWHGPRWEYSGDRKTFRNWLKDDREGTWT